MSWDARPIDLYSKIVELIDRGAGLAAAIVLSTQGSTPQRVGARAIIEPSGQLWGTVGGGGIEAETQRVAAEACRSQRARIFDFDLGSRDTSDEKAICGGRMRVLVDPQVARHRACFVQAADALLNRRRGCLITRMRAMADADVEIEWLAEKSLDSVTAFPGGEAIRACLENGRPERFVDEARAAVSVEEVFVEPVLPDPLLVIAGGGHVGRAVAIEAFVGFEVVVIDDRPEFVAPDSYPLGVKVRCGPVPREIAACPLDEHSYIVLATRGHRHDSNALCECIHRRLAYLGMIGSRRKVALVRRHFLESGLATVEEFDRIRAPIGLEIGAVTVPEIAVSVVAELIAVRRKVVRS